MSTRRTKVKLDTDDADATLYIEHEGPDSKSPVHRVVAKGYHYATNPTTGLPAVFTDGETVPDWAITDEERVKLGNPPTV